MYVGGGCIHEEPLLFDMSIAENIALGHPPKDEEDSGDEAASSIADTEHVPGDSAAHILGRHTAAAQRPESQWHKRVREVAKIAGAHDFIMQVVFP